MGIYDILKDRGETYGSFSNVARISQSIKLNMHGGDGWPDLSDEEREALDMIAVKIARLVEGGSHRDSMDDIIGYTKLMLGETG